MIRQHNGVARDRRWPVGSFLASLSERQREELLALGAISPYRRGGAILNQGVAGDSVLLLLDGVAKVFLIYGEGDESLLALRSRGEVIGEMAFVTRQPRSARVVAATDVTARVVSGADFRAFLKKWPEVHDHLTAAVIRKLHRANDRRAEFRLYTATGRLAIALSDAAEAVDDRTEDGMALGPEVTQADLAALSSVSTSVVEKCLKQWQEAGLVVRQRTVLIVTDPAVLRALAESERRNP